MGNQEKIQILKTQIKANYIDNPYSDTYQNITQCDIAKIISVLDFRLEWPMFAGISDYLDYLKLELASHALGL